MKQSHPLPSIPAVFANDIPCDCFQIVLVLSPSLRSITAKLWMLVRASTADGWRSTEDTIPVTIGRNGLAWGDGEHSAGPPAGFLMKQEGDGCAPAGVFQIPFAFGYAESANGLRLPYRAITPTMFGVDDVASSFYNQVVDTNEVSKDWTSDETMLRADGLYRWGASVAHNPQNKPGAGSCIFLHLWRGPESPTAGCTAMAEPDLIRVLRWLDTAKKPLLVQGLAA